MSAPRESTHPDDLVILMVDIDACPFAELLLTEIYDVETSTVRDDYPIVLRNYITQQLEDTTWFDTNATSALSNVIFRTFMRKENGDILSLRKPALQRKIGQILRSRTNATNPIAIPLLVRFMIPGLPPLSVDPIPIPPLDGAFSCSSTDRGTWTSMPSATLLPLPSHIDDAMSGIGKETLVAFQDSLIVPDATHGGPNSQTGVTVTGYKNVQKNCAVTQSDKDDYADKHIAIAPASALCSTTTVLDDTRGESAIRNRQELRYDVLTAPRDDAMTLVQLIPTDCIGAPSLRDSGETDLAGCAITMEDMCKYDIFCDPSGVSINLNLLPSNERDIVGNNPNVILTLLSMGRNMVPVCDCIAITTTSYRFPFHGSDGAAVHRLSPLSQLTRYQPIDRGRCHFKVL